MVQAIQTYKYFVAFVVAPRQQKQPQPGDKDEYLTIGLETYSQSNRCKCQSIRSLASTSIHMSVAIEK